MKKNNLGKLALLGLTGGLFAVGQPGIEAAQDSNSIDLQYLIAKPKCASHGCAGLMAERDTPDANEDDLLDDDSDSDDIDSGVLPPIQKGSMDIKQPVKAKTNPQLTV